MHNISSSFIFLGLRMPALFKIGPVLLNSVQVSMTEMAIAKHSFSNFFAQIKLSSILFYLYEAFEYKSVFSYMYIQLQISK